MRYLMVGALALVAGCVAQVRVAAPPPVVYTPPPPPPPPVYVAPEAAAEVQASEAPPPLPDYEQPPCPEDGYLWTPGYWAFGPGGYYWVPGTWVQPPRVGVLWTPGYWGFVGGVYVFHAGYWGPHVGFYGGVNYGYGYHGVGYVGGRWAGNSFAYNQSVTHINVTVVHNTYNETVINNVNVTRVSYNGGAGGIAAAPTLQERQAAQEPHVAPTALQQQHVQEAARNPALFARANAGRPSIAATPRPAVFHAAGVVGARGVELTAPHPAVMPRGNVAGGTPPATKLQNAAAPSAARPLATTAGAHPVAVKANLPPTTPPPPKHQGKPKAPPKFAKPELEHEAK